MKRILIIEDDRDIVELVRYNLANEGFEVSAATASKFADERCSPGLGLCGGGAGVQTAGG